MHVDEAQNAVATTVWLADLTYTQQTVAADVIPMAIGGIATYMEANLGLEQPVRLFKYPEKLAEALEQDLPQIIGFSNYVWNATLALEFMRIIKEVAPRTVTVMGGPNYSTDPSEQIEFLRRHPQLDFYIVHESEPAFTSLVRALAEHSMDIATVKNLGLESVHCIDGDGAARLGPPMRRLRRLDDIPSPYLSGKLDEFFDGTLLPVVQTNRGCPFSCTFCAEGVPYYSFVCRNSREKLDAEFMYIGRKMQELREKGGRNDLFIADSNFGMYPQDLDTAKALAETRKRYNWPEYINVATGKNKKERVLEVSRLLEGALRLSGSVQSLDPEVLQNIRRKNIDLEALFHLGLEAEKVGANTYSEIILALPGDSLQRHMETVRQVMNAGFTNIYLFQLMLLPGTPMADPATRETYGMVTRFRVLPRCYGHYEVLGRELVAAEIEEICVASNTLSFEDYLTARRFHLLVTIFYNDGVFASVLKLLRGLGVPVFQWMERLMEASVPEGLAPLFESFLDQTRNELWESREELEAFTKQPGTVEKYIAGELGSNLLFVHKSLGITTYLDQLAVFARGPLRDVLSEHGHKGPAIETFVDDALRYHTLRAANLFLNQEETSSATLTYDVEAFLRSEDWSGVEEFRLPEPVAYDFTLSDEQMKTIELYMGIYGATPVAIGRILSKVHVKKLFRSAVPR